MSWEEFNNIKGPKGDKGPAGTISSISSATVPPGTPARATITGTADVHMHLELPQGERGKQGPPGVASSASAVSVAPDKPAKVILSQHGELVHVEFEIPRGLPGVEAIPTAEAIGQNLAAPDSPARPGLASGMDQVAKDPSSKFAKTQQAQLDAGLAGKANLQNGVVPDTELGASTSATAGTIPKRGSGGRLLGVGSPTTGSDATNKTYVDSGLEKANTFAENQNGFVSVLNFGAVPDGQTDCTAAIESAAREVERRGGGCLLFPPGKYRQDGFVRLSSHTTVMGYGATILKTFSTAAGFTSVAFGALGGSGWIQNISMFGLTFQGNLPTNGVMALWAHRLTGLSVRHVNTLDSVRDGHVFDLMGVTDGVFEDCTFSGAKDPVGGREYAECIQLDASVYTGSPLKQENHTETFDGTSTKRITVRRCRFLKQGAWLAPRPVGCHSAVEKRPYEDILVERNHIETPQSSSNWAGVMNFLNVDGVTVSDNTFEISSTASFSSLVNFSAADIWVKLADVTKPGAQPVAANGGALNRNKVVHSNRSASAHLVAANMTDKLIDYHESMKDYSAGQAPALQVSASMVELTGAMTLVSGTATSAGIASTNGIVVAKLPPGLYPAKTVPAVCHGSGNNTFLTEVRYTGEVVIMRYPDGAATNPWLSFGITWSRQ